MLAERRSPRQTLESHGCSPRSGEQTAGTRRASSAPTSTAPPEDSGGRGPFVSVATRRGAIAVRGVGAPLARRPGPRSRGCAGQPPWCDDGGDAAGARVSPAGHLGQRSVWTSARSPPGVPRAGAHCQRVHTHLVQAGQIDLQHVQADELYARGLHPTLRGGSGERRPERAWCSRPALGGVGVWRQAMAMAVPGAPLARRREISARRDKQVT